MRNLTKQALLFSLCIGMLGALNDSDAQIVSTVPARNATSAPIQTDIVFRFSEPVNPVSVTDSLVFAWGRWSGRALGVTELKVDNTEIHFTPNSDFFYGEMVTVRLPNTVELSSGSMLTGGYTLQFWTGLIRSGTVLNEINRISTRSTGETFIQSYGAYSGDLDEDGFVDLIIPNERTNDLRIFRNDGLGDYPNGFSTISLEGGSAPSTNEGGDFNRDGHIDFAVGNSTGTTVNILTGNGSGGFVREDVYETGSGVRGLCTGDFNGDGWEDIVTTNRAVGKMYVLLNNGDGSFANAVVFEPGGSGESGCAVADFSGDGIEDLFVGNKSGNSISVMLGDGIGGFQTVNTIPIEGEPWMLAAGDLNGDGVPDVVSANSSGNNVSVSLMQASGQAIENKHYFSGSFQLAVDLGDIDGDGDLDVVTSNFSSRDFSFWKNNGDGILSLFTTQQTTGAGSCMILHDRDGDGDLDATGIDELDDLLILYDNKVDVTGVFDPNFSLNIVEVFPNPTSEKVTIRYRATTPVSAKVSIYNSIGHEIAVLMNGIVDAGDSVRTWDSTQAASGTYFVVSKSPRDTVVRSIVVAR